VTFRAVELTIGTTAVAIATATAKNVHEITLSNDYNKTIYVGGPDVAIGGGFSVQKNVPVVVRIANGDVLYAITNTGTSDLHVYDFQVDP